MSARTTRVTRPTTATATAIATEKKDAGKVKAAEKKGAAAGNVKGKRRGKAEGIEEKENVKRNADEKVNGSIDIDVHVKNKNKDKSDIDPSKHEDDSKTESDESIKPSTTDINPAKLTIAEIKSWCFAHDVAIPKDAKLKKVLVSVMTDALNKDFKANASKSNQPVPLTAENSAQHPVPLESRSDLNPVERQSRKRNIKARSTSSKDESQFSSTPKRTRQPRTHQIETGQADMNGSKASSSLNLTENTLTQNTDDPATYSSPTRRRSRESIGYEVALPPPSPRIKRKPAP